MNRVILPFSLLVIGAVALSGGGCSSGRVSIGEDGSDAGNPGGGEACGGTTCTQGERCCSGADVNCTPTCMRLSTCPVLGRPCLSDAGSATDAEPSTDAAPPRDAPPPIDATPSLDAEPGGDGSSSRLKWYLSCGDPVCHAPESDAGLTDTDGGACPAIGSPCPAMGDTCGTRNSAVACGAVEVCSNVDPKSGPGGCPISSRKFKREIEYLDEAQLQQLHDETLRMHLATYNYKGQFADPNPKHLGFIIEDNPQSLAVERGRDQVDLYGYVSMVVATMQVQEKEIADLKRDLDEARRRPATCPPHRP